MGFFVAVATVLLFGGFSYYIYHTADRKGWFVEKCRFFTHAKSAEGLKVGDPITLMGFTVGEITKIETQPPDSYYRLFIGFEVRRPYYLYIWGDSRAKIAASGFLSQRGIEITAGVTGEPKVYEAGGRVVEILYRGQRIPIGKAPNGAFVPPDEQPGLGDRADKMMTQVEHALPSFLAMTNRLNAVLDNAAQLTANAIALSSNANHLVVDAQPIVTNLAGITSNLRNPRGSLGEWILPTNLQTQLSGTVANVNSNLNSLNQTLLNLASITSNLNSQVQANDQILDEISRLVIQSDDLVQGLKRHWLLRSAFPAPATNAPQPLLEPEVK